MAQQTINRGTVAGDGTGENLFLAFGKVNDNFTDLYTGKEDAGTAAAAVVTHVALADPHTQYALESSLGDAATKNVGTTAGTVAAGDHNHTGVYEPADATILKESLGNRAIGGIKTATFNSEVNNATTTGAVTVDWTAAQNQKQAEPTGSITYTFTAPPGPCHLQLKIESDGTSTAQTITWPASVIWLGATWAGVNNKKAIINFWYDGTNYFAIGSNQV